jgi:polyisoprenoid-binding protein YceI
MTRRHRLAAAAVLALLASRAAAQEARYAIDPERSFVHWEVVHFATSTMRGRFGPIVGEIRYDTRSGRGQLGIVIDTNSLSTGSPLFDARLRQADLFASAAYPQAWFSVGAFQLMPGAAAQELRGEVTIKGISAPLALQAARFSCRAATAISAEVCGGDFEAQLLRSEFGMSFGLPFIADKVRLVVQVEAQRRP